MKTILDMRSALIEQPEQDPTEKKCLNAMIEVISAVGQEDFLAMANRVSRVHRQVQEAIIAEKNAAEEFQRIEE